MINDMSSKYETLAQKYIGDGYRDMTPQQQISHLYDQLPLDSGQKEVITAGLEKITDDEARVLDVLELRAAFEVPQGLINAMNRLKKELAQAKR
jgi:hypothetical protein